MELKLSVKQILLDILCIKDQITEHFQGNKKYQTLLQFLNAKDYYNDDDLSIPTLKEIETKTGFRTYQLRKQLKDIYKEYFDTYPWKSIRFKETVIYFNLSFYKRYAMFKTKQLEFVPRVGEQVRVPFLRAKLGFDQFFVRKVQHEFTGNQHIIDIDLRGGFYNSYYQFRLDQAISTGEIGYGLESRMYDFEMEERLGLKRF